MSNRIVNHDPLYHRDLPDGAWTIYAVKVER